MIRRICLELLRSKKQLLDTAQRLSLILSPVHVRTTKNACTIAPASRPHNADAPHCRIMDVRRLEETHQIHSQDGLSSLLGASLGRPRGASATAA